MEGFWLDTPKMWLEIGRINIEVNPHKFATEFGWGGFLTVSVKSKIAASLLLASLLVSGSAFALESDTEEKQAAKTSTVSIEKAKEELEADKKNEESNKVNARPVRDKWALIIGIGHFKDKKVPKLKYATQDANDFYGYLINEANFKKDHVRILLNEDATRERILHELDKGFLGRFAEPDDMVVIFVSTHGSPSQLDARNKNYLVAYDTSVDRLFASGIQMQQFNTIIKRNDAKRTLVVLDACHSGNVTPNAKGIYRVGNFDAQALSVGSGQMVICSSSPSQQSWESKRYKNGVFTRKLLENLRKRGTATSIETAFSYTKDEVDKEVSQDYPGKSQTPQIHSAWSGADLVLAVRPTNPTILQSSVFETLEPDSSPENLRKRRREQFVHGYKPQAISDKPDELVLTRKYFSDVENPEEAYTAACSANAANFNNPDFYYRKALIQIQLEKYSNAAQTLKGVIVDNPQNYEYYLARGFCYHKMGQHGLAASDIRQALFTNPLLPKKIVFGKD